MTEASPLKIPATRVSIRRGHTVVRDVPTHSLIPRIREGRLHGDDEISGDGKRWVRLDRHHQLARYFNPEASAPNFLPDMEDRLSELSTMLKELNQ